MCMPHSKHFNIPAMQTVVDCFIKSAIHEGRVGLTPPSRVHVTSWWYLVLPVLNILPHKATVKGKSQLFGLAKIGSPTISTKPCKHLQNLAATTDLRFRPGAERIVPATTAIARSLTTVTSAKLERSWPGNAVGNHKNHASSHNWPNANCLAARPSGPSARSFGIATLQHCRKRE